MKFFKKDNVRHHILLCNVICLILVSCNNVEEKKALDDQLFQTQTMGHAGMGFRNPFVSPNSMKSIKKCLQTGASGTELDVQLTKDAELVIIHDDYIEFGEEERNLVHDLNWTGNMENLYISTGFLLEHKVQSLKQVFNAFEKDKNFLFSLDCKLNHSANQDREAYLDQFVESLIETVDSAWFDRIFIESRDIAFLNKLSSKAPQFKRFYLPSDFQQGFDIALKYRFTGLSIKLDSVSKENIRAAKENGLEISVYNVNTRKKNKIALSLVPDYIQSDRVGHLVSLIDR